MSLFDKITKKQDALDLSKQTLEQKVWRAKLLKFAERMLEEAKKEDMTLQDFKMSQDIATQIITLSNDAKKLTDIFPYAKPEVSDSKGVIATETK